MMGCPHCEHHVWSTDAWTKHIHTHHPGLLIFVEMKSEDASHEESEEVLVVLASSQTQLDAPFTST